MNDPAIPADDSSRRAAIGWAFVALQAVLLTALVVLPGGGAWSAPGWLRSVGFACILAGLGLIAISSLRLGSALTPTPVPTAAGSLQTGGLYRFVRHPIYTGVLLVIGALVVPSGNWATLAVSVLTVAFFYAKSTWEEQRLAERYPGYAEYRMRTPRFFPRLPH